MYVYECSQIYDNIISQLLVRDQGYCLLLNLGKLCHDIDRPAEFGLLLLRGLYFAEPTTTSLRRSVHPLEIIAPPRDARVEPIYILAARWLLGRELLQDPVKLFDETRNLVVLVADMLWRKFLETWGTVGTDCRRHYECVALQGLGDCVNGIGSWGCESASDSCTSTV